MFVYTPSLQYLYKRKRQASENIYGGKERETSFA